MRLRPHSDIHLDSWFGTRKIKGTRRVMLTPDLMRAALTQLIPSLPDDKDTVLVLAGDIWEGLRPFAFGLDKFSVFSELSARFKAVVVVLGNHDFYGEKIPRLYHKYREALAVFTNVHLLEASEGFPSVVIDGYRFLGGTLWTNIRRGDPLAMVNFNTELGDDGRFAWSDRRLIRTSPKYHKFDSRDWLQRHKLTMAKLEEQLVEGDEPAILVSHMASNVPPPHMRSRQLRSGDLSDAFYYSDLSGFFMQHPRIIMAIHGHTHDPLDYTPSEEGPRFICNPAGYRSQGAKGYRPDLVVALP